MTKKMKKLEQDTNMWKGKWESCDKLLQNCSKIVNFFNKYTIKQNLKNFQINYLISNSILRYLVFF